MRKASLRAPVDGVAARRRNAAKTTTATDRRSAPRRNASHDTPAAPTSAATDARERKRAPPVRVFESLLGGSGAPATTTATPPFGRVPWSPLRISCLASQPTASSSASALFTPLSSSSSTSSSSSECRSMRVASLSAALSPTPRPRSSLSSSSSPSPTHASHSAGGRAALEPSSSASPQTDDVPPLVDRLGATIPHRVLVEWLVEFQHKRLVACGYETDDRPAYDVDWVRAQSDPGVVQGLVQRILAHTPDARVNLVLAVDAITHRLETRRETERRERVRTERERCVAAAIAFLRRTKRSVADSFSNAVRANARVTDRCDITSSVVHLDHTHRLAWIVFKRMAFGDGGGDGGEGQAVTPDDDDGNVSLWRMPAGAVIRRACSLAKTRADDALLAQLVYWQDRAAEDAEERRTKTARCAIRALVAQTRERLPIGTVYAIPLTETWIESASTGSESSSSSSAAAAPSAVETNDSLAPKNFADGGGGGGRHRRRSPRRRAAKKGRRSHETPHVIERAGSGNEQSNETAARVQVHRRAHRVIPARVYALDVDESTARLTLETTVEASTERVVPGLSSSAVVCARQRVVYRPNFDGDGDGGAFWEARPIEFSSGRRSDAIRSRLRAADIGDDGDDSLMVAVLARNVEQAMRHRANYHSCVAALVAQYAVGLFPVDGRDGPSSSRSRSPPPPQLESGSGSGGDDGTDGKREAKIETVADRTSVDAERRRGRGRPRGVRNSRSRKRKPASSDDDDDDESSDYDNVSD